MGIAAGIFGAHDVDVANDAHVSYPQAFFCCGCRYRVTAEPGWTVAEVKQALWAGGIARANKPPERGGVPGMRQWQDLALVYAGQVGAKTHCKEHGNVA
eukprot:366036-Chlamydomonas_euryale.AAC.13